MSKRKSSKAKAKRGAQEPVSHSNAAFVVLRQARSHLARAKTEADTIVQSIDDSKMQLKSLHDQMVRAKKILTKKKQNHEAALRAIAEAEVKVVQAENEIAPVRSRLCWGQMSADLSHRILRLAGGRGRRLMAAACCEFHTLVAGGRCSSAFAEEPRLVLIGSMEGSGVEAYDEEHACWEHVLTSEEYQAPCITSTLSSPSPSPAQALAPQHACGLAAVALSRCGCPCLDPKHSRYPLEFGPILN